MRIQYSRGFVKNFKVCIKPYPKLHERFDQRVKLFIKNPSSPVLKDHRLIGRLRSFRAFSVTGDIKVVYSRETKDKVVFIDIGTYNQEYS